MPDPLRELATQLWESMRQSVQEQQSSADIKYPPTSLNPSHDSTASARQSTITELVKQAREEPNPQILYKIAEQIIMEGSTT